MANQTPRCGEAPWCGSRNRRRDARARGGDAAGVEDVEGVPWLALLQDRLRLHEVHLCQGLGNLKGS